VGRDAAEGAVRLLESRVAMLEEAALHAASQQQQQQQSIEDRVCSPMPQQQSAKVEALERMLEELQVGEREREREREEGGGGRGAAGVD
jgi:sensor c-di-GMP phosphodiesterase-like protein